MTRGEIWWGNLPQPYGSEPGLRRPFLILQADSFNRSSLRTVMCAAITSNLRLADLPGNVMLPAVASNLPKDSVVNVSQIVTIDRRFLTDHVGAISGSLMNTVEEGIRLVLELA